MKLNELSLDADARAKMLDLPVSEVERMDAVLRFNRTLAQMLLSMRKHEGMTQADLAKAVGLQRSGRVSHYESGQIRHAVNTKALAQIVAVLGYNLEIRATKTEAGALPDFSFVLQDEEPGSQSQTACW